MTLSSYETVQWTKEPEWALISSFSVYSVCLSWVSSETISSALNLCDYLMANLSGPFLSLHGFVAKTNHVWDMSPVSQSWF